MATILDVAKHAGVSKSTASRVVTNSGNVSASARAKVEQAVTALGYRPNSIARSLKQNRSDVIGVVVVDIGSPFYTQVIQGIQDEVINSGKQVMVSSGFGCYDTEKRAVNSLIDKRCDGLLLFLESKLSLADLGLPAEQHLPIVCMGSQPQALDTVSIENERGAYDATLYLIEQGHRRILHLAGPQKFADAELRVQGFWRAIDEARIPRADCQVIVGEFNEQFGYQATQDQLQSKNPPTAIFAGDDGIAAGVYSALREANISIPDSMSVMGFDDDFHARYMYPPLTTVRQPIVELGRIAAQRLLKRLDNPALDIAQQCLSAEIIKRGSVIRYTE